MRKCASRLRGNKSCCDDEHGAGTQQPTQINTDEGVTFEADMDEDEDGVRKSVFKRAGGVCPKQDVLQGDSGNMILRAAGARYGNVFRVLGLLASPVPRKEARRSEHDARNI